MGKQVHVKRKMTYQSRLTIHCYYFLAYLARENTVIAKKNPSRNSYGSTRFQCHEYENAVLE
jgi:hypothetical protein